MSDGETMRISVVREAMLQAVARIERLAGAPTAEQAALLETDVYDVIEALGLRAPKRRFLSLQEIGSLFASPVELGDVVYAKLQAPGLHHKTEAGAVRRVACDVDAIMRSVDIMIDRSGLPEEQIAGILLVEAVEAETCAGVPVELLLGARRTHDFGPIVAMGVGGVAAEFWNERLREEDRPALTSAVDMNESRAASLLDLVTLHPLWSGEFRGRSRLVEETELTNWVKAWAQLIAWFDGSSEDRSPRIIEAEVNPLVIRNGEALPLDGLIRISAAPVNEPTDRSDHRLCIDSLYASLHPDTVAVAGVSAERVNPGRIILHNLVEGGFKPDQLAVIKPDCESGQTIEGVACYPNISDTPHKPVDLFVLAVDAESTVSLLEDAAGSVTSALLIAGGTTEREAGADVGARLARVLDQTGVVAIGPNSLGLISRPAGLDTLFIPQFKLPRAEGESDPVAYISQSGAFMITRMNRLPHLEPRYALSIGNQIRTGVSDLVEAVARDESVRVFAVYAEGFVEGDGARFCEVARRLHAAGRAVILYKGGRTATGSVAASGHTAAIAGDYDVCRQLVSEAGAIVAHDFNAFEDLVRLATGWAEKAPVGRPVGHRLALVSNAGYECVGMADQLRRPLRLAEFDADLNAKLIQAMSIRRIDRLVDVRNPLDLTPMATPPVWLGVAEALLESDAFDALVFSPVPPTPGLPTLPKGEGHGEDVWDSEGFAARLGALVRESRKPVALNVDCGPMYDAFADALEKFSGAPVFRSADRLIRALCSFAAVRPLTSS